jgi:hypothetical protein
VYVFQVSEQTVELSSTLSSDQQEKGGFIIIFDNFCPDMTARQRVPKTGCIDVPRHWLAPVSRTTFRLGFIDLTVPEKMSGISVARAIRIFRSARITRFL